MSDRALRLPGSLGLLLCCGTWAACTTQPQPKSTNYMISAGQAEFYKYGPAQAFGPDLALKKGDRVTLLQRQFGFSHVLLADGTSGYVATDDLAPAPAPAPTPRPTLALAGGRSSGGLFRRAAGAVAPSREPLFDMNDTPLPQEPGKPGVKFRY